MRKGREKENQRLFLIKLTLWSQKTQLVTQSYCISSDKVNTFPASQNSLCGEEKTTNLYANFFIFPFIDQRSPNRTFTQPHNQDVAYIWESQSFCFLMVSDLRAEVGVAPATIAVMQFFLKL